VQIDPRDFRIPHGKRLRLKRWPTRLKPRYKSAKHYQELLAADAERLDALQQLLAASDDQAVLLVFQGMDAAGKDGAIGHVLHGVNPQGCDVYSFKVPSAEELQHDFLWRTACRLPARDCLRATSTKTAPWHVVPADDKYNARLIIARIVIEALRSLDLRYPKVTRSRRSELRAIGRQLSQG
jgi:polyphosphate kinase 2 (PPK2 family)